MTTIVEDKFGTFPYEGKVKDVKRFTFTNKNGASMQVIDFGATIVSVQVHDKSGKLDYVTLWYDGIEGYKSSSVLPYLGATIGRVANRIGKGKFKIGNEEYQITQNKGENHLHGGERGFDKVFWNAKIEGDKVVFSYLSKDGEEGYPGEVLTHVTYKFTDDNEIVITMIATASKSTPVNLTNHSYFNLAGHKSGSQGLYEHIVTINADNITAVDSESIPTGKLQGVENTLFDLRKPTLLKDVINKTPNKGYDHNFCINVEKQGVLDFVARVEHPGSGRVMEVFSNQPGVQFYTSNFFPEDDSLKGHSGAIYKRHGAFCLETQIYPDAVNHVSFPNAILYPGDGKIYQHDVIYRFSTAK